MSEIDYSSERPVRSLVEIMASLDPDYERISGNRGFLSTQSTLSEWVSDEVESIRNTMDQVNDPDRLWKDYRESLESVLENLYGSPGNIHSKVILNAVDFSNYGEAFYEADRADAWIDLDIKSRQVKAETEEMLEQIMAQVDTSDEKIEVESLPDWQFGR